ncbi:MAG: ferredoxin [Candidatus Babeliales bacterium]|jgi:ferredoxin|nr:MAG: 4Fe-4S ferredoxin iron-sulfur binding domain-containing protein [candidate division TM6 bacterium GW2011_GWF2_36_6]
MIKKAYVSPGCISCGTCESICPEVFEVNATAHVKADADIKKYEDLIREAADICPVQAIKVE